MVTGLVYRHPAVLANMAATVDAISGGRLDIGIGTGWSHEECEAYGIELGTMGQAFDRLEEGLQVVLSLLTNATTTFDGQYYQLKDAFCEPKLLQSRPHITMGGSGYRRTVPLVARYADHWNFPAMTDDMLERLPEARSVLARECQRIGRDPTEIRISTMLRVVGDPHGIRPFVERRQKAGVDLLILAPTSHELDDLDLMIREVEGLIER
jgi:alkanesulfonate monooxygenase SsuD/methylene tetrahydromethanopterin reductase-like flavin-dependent oxidoreductase (luciferase family)